MLVVAGRAGLTAPPAHAAEIRAVGPGALVAMDVDLDASATPLGNPGVGWAAVRAAALFGPTVLDVRHVRLRGAFVCRPIEDGDAIPEARQVRSALFHTRRRARCRLRDTLMLTSAIPARASLDSRGFGLARGATAHTFEGSRCESLLEFRSVGNTNH